MSTPPTGAPCARCNHHNPFTGITCKYCGDRLVWADTYAVASGEKCPACEKFNPYINTNCSNCNVRLPWADAVAPRRQARRLAGEGESMTKMWIVCAILAVAMIAYMVYVILQPTART